MKRILLIALALFTCLTAAYAQKGKVKVSGTVTDENGQPLPGAGVVERGSRANGVVTGLDGKYTITVSTDAFIEFSCLGFKTILENVGGRTEINVSMQPDNETLEATVVIGYGTSKKGDLTGTVSVVDMDALKDAPVTNIGQALQGKVAGAEFTSQSGEVGEDATIRIRGSRSISAGNEPLIVVDGVVDAVTSLSEINPADIVNISILKDISSTAIYGSRGANGVILITTVDDRKAEGKTSVTFKSSLTYSTIAGSLDMMNGEEYAVWRNMVSAANSSSTVPFSDPSKYGKGTDWIKELSQDVFSQDYYLAVYRNVAGTSYNISLGFADTPGVVIGSGMDKFTGSLTLNSTISKKLSLNLKGSYVYTDRDRASAAITGTNSNAAVYLSPLLGKEDTWNAFGDGQSYGGLPFNSPWLVAKHTTNELFRNYMMLSPSLKYQFNARLTANLRLSMSRAREDSGYYSPSFLAVQKANDAGGTARRTHQDQDKYLAELTVTYKRKKKRNEFDALAGFTAERMQRSYESYSGAGFTNDSLLYYNMQGTMSQSNYNVSSYWQQVDKLSALARVNYNYARRYYITLTARADGSSNFAENRKWGFFPAVALRWSVMNEKWFKKAAWLNDLSLRLSAGRSGNDAISPYMSLATLNSGPGTWIFGNKKLLSYTPGKLQNSNLSWETTDALNLGFSFAAWASRVVLEADAYVSRTSDLLLSVRDSQTTGYNTYYSNAGSTANSGVEVTLTTKNISTKKFVWKTVLTASHNSQVVTHVGSEYEVVPTFINPRSSTQYIYGYRKGYPVSAIWGYKYEGVWHSIDEIERNGVIHQYASQYLNGTTSEVGLGRPKYADINHDGILDQRDIVYLGSADPVAYGGIENSFAIGKRLTLRAFFTWSLGGYIYNISELWSASGTSAYNKYRFMLGAWTPDNPDSDIVKPGCDDYAVSDKSVYDASWFRLKSVSVSYDVPLGKKTKKYLKGLNVSLSGDNLFLLKNYPGFDPDVNTSSTIFRLDNGSFPRTRSVAFNLIAKF